MRHVATAACLLLLLAARVHAQSPTPATASTTVEFFPRAEFRLGANSLNVAGADDQRFSWDAYFGGVLDVADYVIGRAWIVTDYHPVLGSEYRPFDPNQAYYVLETGASYRIGDTEVAGVFHHISRHLSDRPKPFAIAWNVLEARVLRRVEAGGVTIDGRVGAGTLVQHSFVDYSWTADADLMIRRPIASRVGAFLHGSGELFGIDATESTRDTQKGGRVEAGVRLDGRGVSVELFAGVERRLDADPIDRVPMRWALAGFRLLSR